jgi:putative nucleotidyltransferase with HDIG domain
MSLQPSLEEQELLADTFERVGSQMNAREVLSETLFAACFGLAVLGLWMVHPPESFSIGPASVCLGVLVAATLVRIDTPFGFTVPTQLAFVPLLFAVPLTVVPVAVVVALIVARLPAIVRGKTRVSKQLLMTICNAWFSLGPVAVFAVAGVEPNSAGPVLLVLALGAQFAVDFAISALRVLFAREARVSSQLGETWIYGFDAALSGVGLLVAKDIHSSPVAVLSLLPLLGVLATFARERHQRLTGLLELNNAYHGTALVLGDVVEADDGYTGEHCRSVVQLVMEVGKLLGLSAERRRNLEFGALLHDVGKIAIPKEIINKPGKLDAREWTIIKTHTLEGQRMLDRVGGFMREVGLIVRSHHERWDGEGYPDGLAGDEIPLESRIISCCDTWNAMRTDRSYRKALSYEVALTELMANSGTQFDPRVVGVLAQAVAPEGETEKLSTALNGAEPSAAGASGPVRVSGATPVARSLAT